MTQWVIIAKSKHPAHYWSIVGTPSGLPFSNGEAAERNAETLRQKFDAYWFTCAQITSITEWEKVKIPYATES